MPPDSPAPVYLRAHEDGTLRAHAERAVSSLRACTCCPRVCGADRRSDRPPRANARAPYCGVGRHALVTSAAPHFGEEPPLVGRGGSGAIFFAGCNLGCVFCQNADISRRRAPAAALSADDLAMLMLRLQAQGCHNINLVTPSHVVPQILEALPIAIEGGLRLPLVYNTGGYDTIETLRLLDGVIDIYLPDIKTLSPERSDRLLDARDYGDVVRDALREMLRQVGTLQLDDQGVARRGLIVRHLVMPNAQSDTEAICRFIANDLGPNSAVNLMEQYHPHAEAFAHPDIARAPSRDELRRAHQAAALAGLAPSGLDPMTVTDRVDKPGRHDLPS